MGMASIKVVQNRNSNVKIGELMVPCDVAAEITGQFKQGHSISFDGVKYDGDEVTMCLGGVTEKVRLSTSEIELELTDIAARLETMAAMGDDTLSGLFSSMAEKTYGVINKVKAKDR